VSDGERADNHYRIVDGDRLLISGRATVWQADPRQFAGSLAADIAKLYPQLGAVRIEHRWSGVLGRTIHGMPQIGELSPGIWLASGFGGHGFNTTALAGNLIARAIVDNDDTWRLFLPFELIWAGGLAGRVAAQVGYWWTRRRDELKSQKGRDRQAGDHQAAPAWPARSKEPSERAARSEMPAAAAMEVPAVALPAEPNLDPLPTRMAVPPLPADDGPSEEPSEEPSEGPSDRQRPSRRAMKASRSNR
jgi:gamma-glutamylputrescine oxidase